MELCDNDNEMYEQPRKRFRCHGSMEEEFQTTQQLQEFSDHSQNILETIHIQNIQNIQEVFQDEEWVEAIVIMQNNKRYFATFDNQVYNEDLEFVGFYNSHDNCILFHR